MNRKIYFAGSIRGGRGDAALYKRIIDYINKTDIVVTEHIEKTDMSVNPRHLCQIPVFTNVILNGLSRVTC